MATYNGHRSWNAWNISLWIANNSDLYGAACEALHSTHTLRHATNVFFGITGLKGMKTADGAVYNETCVREALAGLEIVQPKREYDRRR